MKKKQPESLIFGANQNLSVRVSDLLSPAGKASSKSKPSSKKTTTRKAGSKKSASTGGTSKARALIKPTRFSTKRMPGPKTLTATVKATVPTPTVTRRVPGVDAIELEPIGVWDLTESVGYLPQLLNRLNKVQKCFHFFDVQAPIPIDLVSTPERAKEWVETHHPKTGFKQKETIYDNLIAEEFYTAGEPVRKALQLESLIGLAPSMILDQIDGKGSPIWGNLLYSWIEGLVVVSTYDLPQYLKATDRTLEMICMYLAIAALLQERTEEILTHEKLHPGKQLCLFDLSWTKSQMIAGLKQPFIHPECLSRLKNEYREAAVKMVNELGTYNR